MLKEIMIFVFRLDDTLQVLRKSAERLVIQNNWNNTRSELLLHIFCIYLTRKEQI